VTARGHGPGSVGVLRREVGDTVRCPCDGRVGLESQAEPAVVVPPARRLGGDAAVRDAVPSAGEGADESHCMFGRGGNDRRATHPLGGNARRATRLIRETAAIAA